MKPITRAELFHAQIAIGLAIVLQFTISTSLQGWMKYAVISLELLLLFAIGITAPKAGKQGKPNHRKLAFLLIGLISVANAVQLFLVIDQLINDTSVHGKSLLISSLAIFITNIIMFSLWYWELDSPGLTRKHDDAQNANFQFPQNDDKDLSAWHPTYFDYLYLSITNSTAFSPTDTLPLTHPAKALMSTQGFISLLTIVLVTARAVNIIG